ncbi:MAG: hypothetical protein ORN54_10045 [Cyclobacteriaceae bacterium]|nr:hypothetical protein [Cyclobacteriaceae bacterium]
MKLTSQIVTLFLLMIQFSAIAQSDSISFYKKYELETIYLSGSGYIKNNQSFKLRNLSNEFNSTVQGLKFYQAYWADKKKFIVTYTLGLGLLIGGMAYSGNQLNRNVLVLTSLGTIGISLHFSMRSQNRLSKAIWARNRDVLIRQ